MPQTLVRPYAGAFGHAPSLEALLAPMDAFAFFHDFAYAVAPAVASGVSDVGRGFGFYNLPTTGGLAPAISSEHGGAIVLDHDAAGNDDATSLVTGTVFNPSSGSVFLATRFKLSTSLTNQFFFGLATGSPASFFDGAGAIGAGLTKYIGLLTATNTTPTLSTDGSIRIIAKTSATVINSTAVHTFTLGSWVTLGLRIDTNQVTCWVNGQKAGVLAYTADDAAYHANLACAHYGATDIVAHADWMYAAAKR